MYASVCLVSQSRWQLSQLLRMFFFPLLDHSSVKHPSQPELNGPASPRASSLSEKNLKGVSLVSPQSHFYHSASSSISALATRLWIPYGQDPCCSPLLLLRNNDNINDNNSRWHLWRVRMWMSLVLSTIPWGRYQTDFDLTGKEQSSPRSHWKWQLS